MIETSTKEARGYFLLEFTKQLIKNNKNTQIYLLEQILNKEFPEEPIPKPITKQDIQEKIKQRKKPLEKKVLPKFLIKDLKNTIATTPNTKNLIKNNKRVLRIPETRLPQRLAYLKPSPTSETLALPKINDLIKDYNVRTIEVKGPNQKVIVIGTMGRKSTNITLTKQEIDEVLNEFSSKSKIPISEGITKIAAGNLTLTSIKSGEDIHFIIKRITQNTTPRPFYT